MIHQTQTRAVATDRSQLEWLYKGSSISLLLINKGHYILATASIKTAYSTCSLSRSGRMNAVNAACDFIDALETLGSTVLAYAAIEKPRKRRKS